MDSKDMSWIAQAIMINQQSGGNLSEVLETATDTMRERARLFRHVRGLSAEGRLSAYILAGMPILVSAWMFYSNGEYLRPLYTEPLGMMMLGGGVFSLGLGCFWMSRIVKVEV
jgi:tight adherence protein B